MGVHELSIPRVLATALSRSGVTTAGEVSQCSRKWLAENVRYAPDQPIGLHSLRQLGRALRVLGLDFGTGGPPVPGPEPSPEPRRRAETDLGRGGPPIARRRSRSVVLDLPRQAPRIRDRSQKRAVALNARGYAACAMTIQELLPFGLPYTYVELLPPRGITMAGELASCTGPDLERMFPDRRFWLRLDEVSGALRRVGLDLGLELPSGWSEVARLHRRKLALPDMVDPTEDVAELDDNALRACGQTLVALRLPARAVGRLEWVGVHRVGDLARCQPEQISRLPRMGRKTLAVIEERLAALGLRLGVHLPEDWETSALALRGGGQVGDAILDSELERMLALLPTERTRGQVRAINGWGGEPPPSTASVAALYGVTTKCIHGKLARLERTVRAAELELPALGRCLELITARAPSSVADVESALREAGLVRGRIHPEAVRRAARAAGLPCHFRVRGSSVQLVPERAGVRAGPTQK